MVYSGVKRRYLMGVFPTNRIVLKENRDEPFIHQEPMCDSDLWTASRYETKQPVERRRP